MITLEKAKELFEAEMQESVIEISILTGGMAGMVFKVKTASTSNPLVFKLYEKEEVTEEHIDDRVYGGNHLNLVSAHSLLKENNINTFDLLKTGEVDDYTYAVFTFLNGQEANREITEHSVYTETLGKIHSIKRDYQGWVSKTEPYDMGWSMAFKESIYSRLSNIKGIVDTDLYTKSKKYIDSKIELLSDPVEYVLSHLDGLQAVFNKDEGDWVLSGVIDVEDYQFTDQRFVLAGITLSQQFDEYNVTEEFWDSYKSIVAIDKTFDKFEKLFQTYYLLVWIMVHNHCDNVDEQSRCEKLLSSIMTMD